MTEFIEVSKKYFYSVINPMEDIRYRPERMEGIWETVSRKLVGRSTPGYLRRDEEGRYCEVDRYFLKPEYVNSRKENAK